VLLPEPVVNGVTYSVYTHSNASTGANAEIWVQKDVILTVAQRGFVINGESTRDHSGHSVSSAGDVNGDGLDDLIVGTKEAKSYVVFGKQDTAAIELSAIAAGTGGFVISGESMRNHSRFSVSPALDTENPL
jgi:hypothetical protein